MMKKLLLLGSALLFLSIGTKAQVMSLPDTIITDTLHYYFNKYYFKTNEKVYNNFPFYRSAAATVTNVTHCGSRFNNQDVLVITGLEAYAAKAPVTFNTAIPIHLYLCSLDVNNKPIIPAIDSVQAMVGGGSVGNPVIVGGNFTNSLGAVSHTLTKDFAVLFRNMSPDAGDTVYLLRTAGATYTNMAALPEQRCSDVDYGYVRHLKTFYSSRNFTLAPGFGVGTDYEFIVAPRVKYTLKTSHAIPQNILEANLGNIDTLCTRTPFTYTNTSSFHYTNRFYNLLAFYQKWNLYSAFKGNPHSGNWDADSAITWNFEYKEAFSNPQDGRIFLPYATYESNEIINTTTDHPSPIEGETSGCFDANQFRARLRPMSAFGRVAMVKYNIPFKVCLKYCNNDYVGLSEKESFSMLQVFPNPLVNGRAVVSGLKGTNQIRVYDVLGQVVLSSTVSEAEATIDLSAQAAGTYLIKVFNEQSASKAIRVVKQ